MPVEAMMLASVTSPLPYDCSRKLVEIDSLVSDDFSRVIENRYADVSEQHSYNNARKTHPILHVGSLAEPFESENSVWCDCIDGVPYLKVQILSAWQPSRRLELQIEEVWLVERVHDDVGCGLRLLPKNLHQRRPVLHPLRSVVDHSPVALTLVVQDDIHAIGRQDSNSCYESV